MPQFGSSAESREKRRISAVLSHFTAAVLRCRPMAELGQNLDPKIQPRFATHMAQARRTEVPAIGHCIIVINDPH